MKLLHKKLLPLVLICTMGLFSTVDVNATRWVTVRTITLSDGTIVEIQECQRAFLSTQGCRPGAMRMVMPLE